MTAARLLAIHAAEETLHSHFHVVAPPPGRIGALVGYDIQGL
eukprot:CAMPEP_0118927954 /NCGR_PEP_ID=MMETSP1169-20130426/5330_1 /TAXON_ID=36882 /ORGANISM="Pyramimonas obovata, Strain CCMP722" /LENGTH=41 /DNA_ID= /DNA_START= /DNA_END= /DNA_ORIENTATION=